MPHPGPLKGPLPAPRRNELIELPIAVFDSGVGGLTVLGALLDALRGERFVYLGDTARVPYGPKPLEMVRGFAGQIARALVALPAKAVVIACNTASAAALPRLSEELEVPVWGVIESGVEAALNASAPGSTVAVLGTAATLASRVYQDRLEASERTVWAQACPLFVPIVEEGISDSEIARLVANHYLAPRPPLSAAILGCTHYPLLKPVLREVLGADVELIDSSRAIAERVAGDLARLGLLSAEPDSKQPLRPALERVEYLVTGDVTDFVHVGSRLFAPLVGDASGAGGLKISHVELPAAAGMPLDIVRPLPAVARPA